MNTTPVIAPVSERQLVTFRTVKDLHPIEGADRIELALIDGWQVIVKKGEFAPGDRGVFFEIDSILPSHDERFAFMGKSKFRVKSAKMRKVLSQGLLLPVSSLTADELFGAESGIPLQTVLGVIKYEKPIPAGSQGNAAGNFPPFIRKTDQERIQNIPEVLTTLYGKSLEITEKLDGTSFTAWFYNGTTGVASRNFEIKKDSPGWYANVFHDNDLDSKLTGLGRNIAVQGEILGPGIQGNSYRLDKLTLFVFDIFDIDKQTYVSPEERASLAALLKLRHVPVLGNIPDVNMTVEYLLAAAEGVSAVAITPREGIVVKYSGGSFKAISNSWLLSNE